ncbi:glutamate racemase [Amorphus sp. 3PC139-8]|uniref:glutamate racemase n=1 Tax=Amorphus sp. 3PC139-8 TaxID=2735676 RepID=UPI00345D6A83
MTGPILVFDSGLGGTTVLAAIAELLPDEGFVYLVDDAGFPYGGWTDETRLVERIVALVGAQVAEHGARAVVVACNTASTIALPALRSALSIPVVGTVPAVKPAAARSRSGLVSVLATPATVARDYTRDLIAHHGAGADFTLVGAPDLAALAETYATTGVVPVDDVRREIAPCFVEAVRGRTDTIVLACTHYPLLLDIFGSLAPWPVDWIDPAPAIARRVAMVLGRAGETPAASGRFAIAARFTSGRDRADDVARIVAGRKAIDVAG